MHAKLIEIITRDVSDLFGLKENDLFELKVEYGLKYIADRYPSDPRWKDDNEIAEALKVSAPFWNWWIELWAERDRELMKRCERPAFGEGVNYTFLLNGYIGQTRMQETRRIFSEDAWDFYQDFHYWRKVTLYPNEVLIGKCTHNKQSILSTIKQ